MNRDGVMDIFIGSGFEWSEKGLSSMKLINGRSGRVLWSTEVPESAYGTPILVDITGDQLARSSSDRTVFRFMDVAWPYW